MSHGRIFEFSFGKPIDPEERATMDDLVEGNLDFCEYIDDIPDKQRDEELDDLQRTLPASMFQPTECKDVFIWQGLDPDILKKWKKEVQTELNKIDENHIDFYWAKTKLLEIFDMVRFWNADCGSNTWASTSWLLDIACYQTPGTKLYIGGIIDYKF